MRNRLRPNGTLRSTARGARRTLALCACMAVAPPVAWSAEAATRDAQVTPAESAGEGTVRPSLEKTIAIDEAGNQAAAEAQAMIESLSDDVDRLAAEYRRTLQETQALRVYNAQLDDLLRSQQREMASLREQMDGVAIVQRRIMPLMARMIDTLETFVELDLPFLLEERRERVAKLRELMDRADVTMAEKYRRLMEAYQVENEFGRTIEAYRGTLDAGDRSRTVDFLRIGRISLLYQTLDAEETGAWDPERKQWVVLGGEYRAPVRQGLRVARKQIAPDLLYVPVSAPREVQ
jgi:hypothetical protein